MVLDKMVIITLTATSGAEYDFVIGPNTTYGDGYIQNGTHNNGGWKVKETRDEIREKIRSEIVSYRRKNN